MFGWLRKKQKIKDKEYIKRYFKPIRIRKDKETLIYLEWPFGNYVFEEMEARLFETGFKMAKFSLFEALGVKDRDELKVIYENNRERFYIDLAEYVKKFESAACFLVTHDWFCLHRNAVKIFRYLKVPVYCVLHEGVFQSLDKYYDGKIPIADKTLVWGLLHRDIFVARGLKPKQIAEVGSITLNKYKSFKPELGFEAFFDRLKLDKNKKTVVYCCQLCDNQWGDQEACLQVQQQQIEDIICICRKYGYNCIIRNSPAVPDKVIPREFRNKFIGIEDIAFDGEDTKNVNVSEYAVKSGDAVYYSNLLIGMNTTMQLEASILNRPAVVVKYFPFEAKWHDELGLPAALDKAQLEDLIVKNIDKKESLISADKMQPFCNNYGFSRDLSFDPVKNIFSFIEKELRR